MTSRAIHVELANTLSTESFLLAYQRFTAVRGHPRMVWSDPGTNFVGAKPVLKDLYAFLESQDKATLENYAVKNGTQFAGKCIQPILHIEMELRKLQCMLQRELLRVLRKGWTLLSVSY
ncbi:uncharacterized protein LOC122145514 [Tachysurus ichikawai]